ncbi:MAG: cytochrome c [Paracoccaceae bacterium]
MRRPVALVLLFAAGAALAHEGVENPAVMARMELMKDVGTATGTLGEMVKGETPFDAARAAEARAALIDAADRVPTLFEARETDPESEALPAVWEDWDGFVASAMEMQAAARGLETGTAEALRARFGDLGQTCRACHEDYRLDD